MTNKNMVGFVGLGIMGKPMAGNLLKAGYPVTVYDVRADVVEELVTDGAQMAISSKEVAQRVKLVITMLPDGPDVERAILGPDGVLEGAGPGSTIIDMSSISPLVAQKVAADCAKKGVDMLDAPVSGGEPGAVSGTLAIMVGGKKAVFDKCEPLLKVLGKSVVLTGDIGAGNVTKLANQIMVAVNIAGMGEALVLATKAGVDPELVFNAVRGGLAGSAVLEAKGPMVLDRNFTPGFRVRLHHKDLHNTLLTGKELNVPLPLTSLVQQILSALMAEDKGDSDHSAIVTVIEDLAKVEVKKSS